MTCKNMLGDTPDTRNTEMNRCSVYEQARSALIRAACLLALLICPLAAAADEHAEGEIAEISEAPAQMDVGAPKSYAVKHSGLAGLRHNPLGLLASYNINYRHLLFDSDSPLMKNSYAGFGLISTLSPAYGRIGVALEVEPVALLQVRASYEAVGFFGMLDHLMSFPSADSDHSDELMSDRSGEEYSTFGHELSVGGTLQAKAGPIVARSTARAGYRMMDLQDNDEFFYDIVLDVLSAGTGWIFTNDFDLIWLGLAHKRLLMGLRHTYTQAFYGDNDPSSSSHQRVGPLFVYNLAPRPGSTFSQFALLGNVSWWLSHNYRVAPMPYVLLGFQFNGDIL